MELKLPSIGIIISTYIIQLAISFTDIGAGLVFDGRVTLDFLIVYYWVPIFFGVSILLLVIFFCFLRMMKLEKKYLIYSFLGLFLIMYSARTLGDFMFSYYYDVYLGKGMEGGFIEGLPFFIFGVHNFRATWMLALPVLTIAGISGLLLLRKGEFL